MNIRKCLFCGVDISHKNRNAIICGCKTCVSQYDKWRRECKKNNPHRYCIICGTCIDELPAQQKICLNPECLKQRGANNYLSKLYIKKCEKCGKEFEGTAKQKLCEECRKNYHKDTKFQKIQQTVICKDCGKIIEIREKNKTKDIAEIVYALCDECKNKHREEFKRLASERMKKNNPMKDKKIAQKVGNTNRKNYIERCKKQGIIPKVRHVSKCNEEKETPLQLKMRMMIHNPMFNEGTKKQATETLRKRIESGEITYKKGKDNPLWKGNRNFNKSVRIELRKWVKQKFDDTNYTCQICGKNKIELHVHHLKPLRDIIQEYFNEHNLDIEYVNGIEGSDEYFNIIKELVEYHYKNMNIGIVVCPECHSKIDKQYKRKTHD